MGIMTTRNISLLFLSLGVLYAAAQHNPYPFTRIDVNKGLSHNQIKSVFKDEKGFLWVGTISGLNRYDGYSIKVFRNNPSDTLSIVSNDINKIFEGPAGTVWIHTWSGTNVFDPSTETFDRNINKVLREFSIPEGQINDIKKDSKGNYWFTHSTQGLFRYDALTRKTTKLSNIRDDDTSINSNQIASLVEDPSGHLWLLHTNGILEMLDPETMKVISRHMQLNERFRGQILEYNMTVDADGELWCYITNNNSGLFHFKVAQQKWNHIRNNSSSKPRLNADIVRGLVQDRDGRIWVATDHGGINIIDKIDLSVEFVLHNKDDDKSLSQNSINVLYKDRDDIIWAGTFKNGLSYYHPNINRFRLITHQASNPHSLPFNDINAIVEDDKQNLWIGTNGGGLIYYNRAENKFTQYLHDPANPASLSTNVIVSLFFDRNKKLWIGTYFGGLNCFDGKKFTRYKHDPDNPGSISDNSIWEIFEDTRGNLWIGTLTQGADLFDREKQQFYHYKNGGVNSIHASYVPAFMEDSDGNLWIGTGYGIDVLDRQSGRFTHYLNQINEPGSLSNNSVLAFLEDSRGLIWVGTHGGLNLFDKSSKRFLVITEENGLPHNSILTILEDNSGNIWVSTPHGISSLVLDFKPGQKDSLNIQFKNYDDADGLQGRQFNENAACKTKKGELVFGGGNGLNIFQPEHIGTNTNKPVVILTDFQVFNKSVKTGETVNGKILLKESIFQTDTIVLDHAQNVFSIEFSSVTHFHPEKTVYRYMMEGFDKNWTTTDAWQRKVTYTNLDPGNYVFKVMAANNDGVWSDKPMMLSLTVLPPFWKSKTAFVLYALAILGALFLARWLVLYNERMRYQLLQEREEAQRMHDLDVMKIRFFTNISHEFRTPLTLILTPLEKMLKNSDGEQRKQHLMIYRNARRLLNLVNQLLDFRKMEVQEIRFNPSEGDIVKFIHDVFQSFTDLSEKKNIRFTFESKLQQLETLFDQDKLEKILFNLLSNAFKFTPENGEVSVCLDIKEEETSKWLVIRVCDNGIGIAKDKQEKIFERFFQNDLPKTVVNQGSGIGLSITKEFVRIHGGSVTVESEPEKGSCFTVSIPLTEIVHEATGEGVQSSVLLSEITVSESGFSGNPAERKPVLLLVEDNEDFRFYLKDNLKQTYAIAEARNGKEGLQRALSLLPDLIVSDIMMPELNGIELCKKLKNDQRTSHIPVILLTARTAEEQKMEGFESGANDYVTKPFNFEILQSRIRNLIAQREAFQKAFHKHIEVKAGDIQITSLDEKLIQKAIKVVEENLSNPDFSVEEFSRDLGMSRVHLYKKLLALTGKSPIEFIRSIRLQRAAQLLEKSQLTVSEIAYQVGFNNPKYFSKYFKDEFKVLPSAYSATKK